MKNRDVFYALNECFVTKMVSLHHQDCVIQDFTVLLGNLQVLRLTLFAPVDIFAHQGVLSQYVVHLALTKTRVVKVAASAVLQGIFVTTPIKPLYLLTIPFASRGTTVLVELSMLNSFHVHEGHTIISLEYLTPACVHLVWLDLIVIDLL